MKTRGLAIVVTVAALLAGGVLGYVITHNSNQISSVHDGAVKACEASTKPGGVRYILAHSIEEQLSLSKSLNLGDLFPAVPPSTLRTLLKLQEDRGRAEIQQLLGVNCEAQYH